MKCKNTMVLKTVTAYLFFSLLSAFIYAQGIQDRVNIKIVPEHVYVEKGKFTQYLNFDFLIENLTEEKLRLTEILIRVYDNENKLICRKMINTNGFNPSINTIGNTNLDKRDSLFVYNPFYHFDQNIIIDKIHYEFYLISEKKEKFLSEIEVRPIYYNPKTNLILPIKERMMIFDGHDFYSHHRRFDLTDPVPIKVGATANPGRYAYDLCVVNNDGDLYKDDKSINENWYGFGVSVYSPASGKVVDLIDSMPDNIPGKSEFDYEQVFENPNSMAGNYIVIDHHNGEYSMLAHFKQGSLKVKEGDEIKQGQLIGQMGFSGATAWWVHIHYELRNGKDWWISEGLPSYFSDFNRILGNKTKAVKNGQIDTGDIVETLNK